MNCQHQWISVDDRLPSDYEDVIVCLAGGAWVQTACRAENGTWYSGDRPFYPTHWMPLPELPE